MEVTFLKLINGGHIQTDVNHKVENLTKSQLFKIADLKHPYLTKKEFFEVLCTDKNNLPKKEFRLFSKNNEYLVVKL